jgi:serine/threonine-protein kinase HipA
MSKICTLQIFVDNNWRDAAAIDLTGDPRDGIAASTYLAYLPGYALEYFQRNDAAALSAYIPANLDAGPHPSWPPFLVDILPQGYGRQELLKQLNRNENAEREAAWDLLCAGAGNPIGNVRVKESYDWVMERTGDVVRGFTLDEVAARAEDFNEYLAQHGLFLAGSSGIQGEWPKILLTRAKDGLYC